MEELKRYCRFWGFSDRGIDREKIRKRIHMFHNGVGVQRAGFDHRYVRLAERGKDTKRKPLVVEQGTGRRKKEVSGRAVRKGQDAMASMWSAVSSTRARRLRITAVRFGALEEDSLAGVLPASRSEPTPQGPGWSFTTIEARHENSESHLSLDVQAELALRANHQLGEGGELDQSRVALYTRYRLHILHAQHGMEACL